MIKNSGFTLMELMITIAIIAILAAVSVPSVISWRENAQLGRAARDVYSDFQRAKLEAVKRNTWCSLVFTAGSGYSVFVDSNQNRNLDAGETILSTRSWSDYGTAGAKAGENTFITNKIAFAGDGLVRGALGGSIVLDDARGNETSVLVSSAGNIRISP